MPCPKSEVGAGTQLGRVLGVHRDAGLPDGQPVNRGGRRGLVVGAVRIVSRDEIVHARDGRTRQAPYARSGLQARRERPAGKRGIKEARQRGLILFLAVTDIEDELTVARQEERCPARDMEPVALGIVIGCRGAAPVGG